MQSHEQPCTLSVVTGVIVYMQRCAKSVHAHNDSTVKTSNVLFNFEFNSVASHCDGG